MLLFFLLSLLMTLPVTLYGGRAVQMRIVDQPTSYNWNQNQPSALRRELKVKVPPSPISGPPHLALLANNCYQKTIDKYQYEFCPFSNVTQIEQGVVWNPFQGILGVWQEWEIADNHFIAMRMLDGDSCGAKPRQTRVILKCGVNNSITTVSEVQHCAYQLEFSTPLVCHNDSMLVYPTLATTLQEEWNVAFSELEDNRITQKGYEKAVQKIFKEAGLILSGVSMAGETPAQAVVNISKPANLVIKEPYNDVDTCNMAYKELKKQLEETQAQLAESQIAVSRMHLEERDLHRTEPIESFEGILEP